MRDKVKRYALIGLVSATVFATGVTAASANRGDNEAICHVPPGNPSAAHVITVGAPAVEVHLGHGDIMGDCDGPYSPLFGR